MGNKKIIGLIKYKSNGENSRVFSIETKNIQLVNNDNNENKKAKDTKECVIKPKLKFEDYKNCLEATQHENEIRCL